MRHRRAAGAATSPAEFGGSPGRLEPGPPRVPKGPASLEDKVARFRVLHAIYHGLLPEDLTDLAARRARPALGCQARRAGRECGF